MRHVNVPSSHGSLLGEPEEEELDFKQFKCKLQDKAGPRVIRNKKLLGAPGLPTRSKDATRLLASLLGARSY